MCEEWTEEDERRWREQTSPRRTVEPYEPPAQPPQPVKEPERIPA